MPKGGGRGGGLRPAIRNAGGVRFRFDTKSGVGVWGGGGGGGAVRCRSDMKSGGALGPTRNAGGGGGEALST